MDHAGLLGHPIYTNVQMPFADVPDDNETGLYRRSFRVPRGWRDRPVVLHVGASEGVLHVLVNGAPVGIAKDARTPAEFDVSERVRHGAPNELVLCVVRWSDASFVEDQDQWWHAGLPRSIRLLSPSVRHVRWRGDMHGSFQVATDVEGEVRLLDERGRVVGRGLEARCAERACGRPSSRRCTGSWSRPAARASRATSASARSRCATGDLLVNGASR